MTYREAIRKCEKTGTAHATDDSLRAMYALLVAQMHGGNPEIYFDYLQANSKDDNGISELSRQLLRDRQKAWDVLMKLT